MNDRGKRQASSLFGGMGFYIALLCCVLAAGVVGYYALLKNTTPSNDTGKNNTGKTPNQTADWDAPSQSATTPGGGSSLPVVSTPGDDADAASGKDTKPVSGTPGDSDDTNTLPLGTTAEDFNTPDDSVATMGQTAVPTGPMTVMSPLTGETVAVFSMDQLAYNTTTGDWRTHNGIDIHAAAGTEVAAAAAGTVRSVEQDSRLGTTVIIDHAGGYTTTYASLQPDVTVLAGDSVDAGTVIGTVGNTSLTEAGLGAHLHFTVAKDGEVIDPAEFLKQ